MSARPCGCNPPPTWDTAEVCGLMNGAPREAPYCDCPCHAPKPSWTLQDLAEGNRRRAEMVAAQPDEYNHGGLADWLPDAPKPVAAEAPTARELPAYRPDADEWFRLQGEAYERWAAGIAEEFAAAHKQIQAGHALMGGPVVPMTDEEASDYIAHALDPKTIIRTVGLEPAAYVDGPEPPDEPTRLRDLLGDRDHRIRQLELENAALALELRRATKARGR